MPHILQIVIKNTSTLDYTLPIFWKLKNGYPDIKLSILYCVPNKCQILRDSQYFYRFFKLHSIKEYDFGDFIKPNFRSLKWLYRYHHSQSPWDRENETRSLVSSSSIFDNIKYLYKRIKNKLINTLTSTKRIVSFDKILDILCPDAVLFDNRTVTDFDGREHFYRYFEINKIPVILLPHAPHYRLPDDFCPFDEKGKALPAYCIDWIPFKHATPWVRLPHKSSQFQYIGHPLLDSDWCDNLFKNNKTTESSLKANSQLKCMLIIRKFLPKGIQRTDDTDPFIIDFEDFFPQLKSIAKALKDISKKVELIIKPHPSNNYNEVKKVFMESGIHNWRISPEPFFDLLPKIDFVISFCSTSLLFPIAWRIPTVILDSKLQRYVHRNWDKLKELYTGFQFYQSDNSGLTESLKKITQLSDKKINGTTLHANEDYQHLRRFFPDFSTDRAIDSIMKSIKHNED